MKTLNIEWKHVNLGGQTCDRCGDTGETLRDVIAELNNSCCGECTRIELRETKLDRDGVPESNFILIDGRPLESILPDARVKTSGCDSCGELLGEPTDCRALETGGMTHEAIPAGLIRAALCKAAECCDAESRQERCACS
jgi:hypothetical protein